MSQPYKEGAAVFSSFIHQGFSEEKLHDLANEVGFYDAPHVETQTERGFHKFARYLGFSPVARYIARFIPEISKRINFHHTFRKEHPEEYRKGRSTVLF